ncbi:MAG: TPM domain-containing protein [archaeon]
MQKTFLILIILIVLPFTLAYPKLTGYVTDTAGIITQPALLEQHIAQIEQNTTAEIAIVTVPNLEGEEINAYAVKLFEEAGIGKKDKDNGMLILIAVQEKQYKILVGYGLEGSIPDANARIIGEKVMAPAFKQDDFDGGLQNALTVIEGFLVNNEEIISQYQKQSLFDRTELYYLLIFLAPLIMTLIIFTLMNKKRNNNKPIPPIMFGGFGGGFGGGLTGFGGGFRGGFGGFGGGMTGGGGFGGHW